MYSPCRFSCRRRSVLSRGLRRGGRRGWRGRGKSRASTWAV